MKTTGATRLAAACALVVVAGGAAATAADQIPITTSSEEARQLYLKGRDLVEKLRATDARPLFLQAAAKDPGFAMAQVGLANSAGTAKEFFDAVGRATALADSKIKARLTDLGNTVLVGLPADFGKLIVDETEKWGKVVKFSGAKPD